MAVLDNIFIFAVKLKELIKNYLRVLLKKI
jgi:hypothetical protein